MAVIMIIAVIVVMIIVIVIVIVGVNSAIKVLGELLAYQPRRL